MSSTPEAMDLDNDIAVVGMGPGGLAAAIGLAQKGKRVTIFEKRESFSRTQKVKLKQETENFIKDLMRKSIEKFGISITDVNGPKKDEIDSIIERLKDSIADRPDELKQIEKELGIYKRLLEDTHSGIKLNNLQFLLKGCIERLYPEQITIEQGVDIEDIDPDTHQISYKDRDKNPREMKFSHIVAADGARHAVADMVRKDDRFDLGYEESQRQTRQKAHGTVRIAVDRNIAVERVGPLHISSLPELQKLGWDKPYLPQVYVWEDKGDNEYYIAGEIPDSFLELPYKDRMIKMEEWGKKIVELSTKYPPKYLKLPEDLDAPEEDRAAIAKMSTTAFPVTMSSARNAAIDLGAGHVLFSVGDAARTANFHLGHGTNDAVADGLLVARCISEENKADISAFNDQHRRRKENVDMGMDYLSILNMTKMDTDVKFSVDKVLNNINHIQRYISKLPRSQKVEVNNKLKEVRENLEKGYVSDAYNSALESLSAVREAIENTHRSKIKQGTFSRIGIAIFKRIYAPLAKYLHNRHLNLEARARSEKDSVLEASTFMDSTLRQVRNELDPKVTGFLQMSYSKRKAFICKCLSINRSFPDKFANFITNELQSFSSRHHDEIDSIKASDLIKEIDQLRKLSVSDLIKPGAIDSGLEIAIKFSPYTFTEEDIGAISVILRDAARGGRSIGGVSTGYNKILEAMYEQADLSVLKVEDIKDLSETHLEAIVRAGAKENGIDDPKPKEIQDVIDSIRKSSDPTTNVLEVVSRDINVELRASRTRVDRT